MGKTCEGSESLPEMRITSGYVGYFVNASLSVSNTFIKYFFSLIIKFNEKSLIPYMFRQLILIIV
jgi:hypothetical protein